MAVNKVDYAPTKVEDITRNHSASIWKDCRINEIQEDPTIGFYYRDDFVRTSLLASPTITTQAGYSNGWKAFGSTPGAIVGLFNQGGQGIKATSGTSDNDGISLATIALPFKVARTTGKFWWEARLKTDLVTNTRGFVAGLMDQQTLTAIVPITAAGALADVNFVGFHALETTGTKIGSKYKANGVAAVDVKLDCTADTPTTTGLVADTYIKLGMKYEPSYPIFGVNSFQFSFFINGYRLPDRVTVSAVDGTDFPNDVLMGLVFGLVNASGAANILSVDWVEAAQEYV